MDASEAREHIEMVERIVSQGSRRLRVGGEFFVVWGVVGAVIDGMITAAEAGLVPVVAFYVSYGIAIAAGIAFSIARSRYYRRCSDRMSWVERQYLNVLWLAISLTFVAMLAMTHIFNSFTSQIALWSFAETLVLFYIAMHCNRRAQVGGIIMLASLITANFTLAYAGWILAAGVLVGYAGFGAAELIAGD